MPSSDEPAHKKQKIEDYDTTTKETLEAISEVQSEIDKLNENASEEIINVERKYNKLRKPVFEKREKFVEKIPNFWLTAFLNHPGIANVISEDDAEILAWMTDFRIDEHEDIKSGYKITMRFRQNPFFTNSELVKEESVSEEGFCQTTCTKVEWTNKTVEKDYAEGDPLDSLVGWMICDDIEPEEDFIDMLKDDLWPNPLQYYEAEDLGDSESSGDENDEEED